MWAHTSPSGWFEWVWWNALWSAFILYWLLLIFPSAAAVCCLSDLWYIPWCKPMQMQLQYFLKESVKQYITKTPRLHRAAVYWQAHVFNMSSWLSQWRLASQCIPWGHFSHVADVSGLSALTLALSAHAKTNVRLTLPIPTCGREVIVPDLESHASCLLHSRILEVLGNVMFPDPQKNKK